MREGEEIVGGYRREVRFQWWCVVLLEFARWNKVDVNLKKSMSFFYQLFHVTFPWFFPLYTWITTNHLLFLIKENTNKNGSFVGFNSCWDQQWTWVMVFLIYVGIFDLRLYGGDGDLFGFKTLHCSHSFYISSSLFSLNFLFRLL